MYSDFWTEVFVRAEQKQPADKSFWIFLQATCIARNDNPSSFDPFSVEVIFLLLFNWEPKMLHAGLVVQG